MVGLPVDVKFLETSLYFPFGRPNSLHAQAIGRSAICSPRNVARSLHREDGIALIIRGILGQRLNYGRHHINYMPSLVLMFALAFDTFRPMGDHGRVDTSLVIEMLIQAQRAYCESPAHEPPR